MANYDERWKTVLVDVEEGIGWVTLNRPEKRNAMSPTLNLEMRDVLETLELDADVKVLVLTGAGTAWTAGMDLKEYFREIDGAAEIVQEKIRRDASIWQWKLLRMYSKPTIAMVNGWCFGGGFSPLVACDLAVASETAVFGFVGDQLGHPAWQSGEQSDGGYGWTSQGVGVHHDRRHVYWCRGGGDGVGE